MRFNSRLRIDLGWMVANLAQLKKIAPNNQILLMVKSNAYGHGMVPIAEKAIWCGIREFGVASLGEGLTLRKHLPQKNFEIYVFSDLECYQNNGWDPYLSNRLLPVLSNMQILSLFLEQKATTSNIPVVLKFNTGMNRLGFLPSELPLVMKKLQQAGRSTLYHVASHFGCASQKITTDSQTATQYQVFLQIKEELQKNGFVIERSSMANSGAIEQNFALGETHIRPGLIVYGPSSLDTDIRSSSNWKGTLISQLETHIIHVQKITQGMPIGYGATKAPRDGILTLLALGYGDGIYNHFQHLRVKLGAFTGEAVGRINMDMVAILWPLEAEPLIHLGTPIHLWDHAGELFREIADKNKISPYEILCGLSERIPRIHVENNRGAV